MRFMHTAHLSCLFFFFFFNDTATTEIYTLSLHDALPIYLGLVGQADQLPQARRAERPGVDIQRSEEHTSELQSPCNLVCRLLLEKKKHRHPPEDGHHNIWRADPRPAVGRVQTDARPRYPP